jgi:hypothetical protein
MDCAEVRVVEAVHQKRFCGFLQAELATANDSAHRRHVHLRDLRYLLIVGNAL